MSVLTNGRWRLAYKMVPRHGHWHHEYRAVGALGGMHLHVTDLGEEHREKYGTRWSGGLETHWRSPPDYMRDSPPSHDECWLLKCPCWHDGTSLYVSEHIVPRYFDPVQAPPEQVLAMLAREADKQFLPKDDDE